MHGDFTGGVGSMAWLGLASTGVGYGGRGVHVVLVCLLQYMLPYAFRRRLEMHGDFTGKVGSGQHGLAWLVYM